MYMFSKCYSIYLYVDIYTISIDRYFICFPSADRVSKSDHLQVLKSCAF